MQSVYVKLYPPKKVQQFVDAITNLDGDFELVSGGYILDAKSLMGIYSLDLTQPLQLKIYNDTEENLAAVAPFCVEGPKGG